MDDGLYKVEFATSQHQGGGVVTLNDGIIQGGDSALYYVGSYSLNGDQVSAEVSTDRHNADPNIQSVFGQDRVNIKLQGTASNNVANLEGEAKEAPGIKFRARLAKLNQ